MFGPLPRCALQSQGYRPVLVLLVWLAGPALAPVPLVAADAEGARLTEAMADQAGLTRLSPDGDSPARVGGIIDGDTLVLGDGRQLRLTGIQAPKLALGRQEFRAWPFAEESRSALVALAADQPLRLYRGDLSEDRHGRVLAHATLADGTWLQGALIAGGFARVYSFADNRALVGRLLTLEAEARRAGRGLWALGAYAERPAEALARAFTRHSGERGEFHLVTGRVRAVARVRSTVYLNFGPDWRSDFTVRLDRPAVRLFEAAGLAPESLDGRRVRVRGWVHHFNGPMIDLTHPEQVELLDE